MTIVECDRCGKQEFGTPATVQRYRFGVQHDVVAPPLLRDLCDICAKHIEKILIGPVSGVTPTT